MDSYYGTATAAYDAASTWLATNGSTKRPSRMFDVTLGYMYTAKASDGTTMRFRFRATPTHRRARR